MDIWPLVQAERKALAADLSGLDATSRSLAAPSLAAPRWCDGCCATGSSMS